MTDLFSNCEVIKIHQSLQTHDDGDIKTFATCKIENMNKNEAQTSMLRWWTGVVITSRDGKSNKNSRDKFLTKKN